MASSLVRGTEGHPLHPPLTDVAIGGYTVATVLSVLGALGVSEDAMGKGAWLALLVGLAGGALSAVTGLADLLTMERGTAAFRTGVFHGALMATSSVLFALAAVFQYPGFRDGEVTGAGLVLTLVGAVVLGVGGALGGSLVFRHGVRVSSDAG